MPVHEHVSEEPDPGERGAGFGRIQGDRIRCTLSAYRRLFEAGGGPAPRELTAAGEQLWQRLAGRFEPALEEIRGIAQGARLDPRDVLALNARSELLGGGAECTVVGMLSPPGSCLVAQNWDFHPDLRDSRVVWTVRQASGAWFTTFTEAGILAKVGLNSRGVGVAINMLRSADDGGLEGVPVHLLLRLILERADNLADALALALQTPVSTSLALTLGYCERDFAAIVTVELSPSGATLQWPDASGLLVHANHFLDRRPDADAGAREFPATYVRQFEAERRLADPDLRSRRRVEDLLASHFDHPHGICCHRVEVEPWSSRCETLASIVMELGARELWLADGSPCRDAYERVAVPCPGDLRGAAA